MGGCNFYFGDISIFPCSTDGITTFGPQSGKRTIRSFRKLKWQNGNPIDIILQQDFAKSSNYTEIAVDLKRRMGGKEIIHGIISQ